MYRRTYDQNCPGTAFEMFAYHHWKDPNTMGHQLVATWIMILTTLFYFSLAWLQFGWLSVV
jgi:hypothetical protein